jgi:hypothetical protein
MSIRESSELSQPIPTVGQLLPDGAAIERLRQNRLVLWHEDHEVIAATIEHNNHTYTAALLDANLEEQLRFPEGTEAFGTAETLITELSKVITTYVSLEETDVLLLATFILSTWTVDCLPSIPTLNLWGPVGTETSLIELMSCLCRNPLPLTEPSIRELLDLPNGLCPTLILNNSNPRFLSRLLAAVTEPGMKLLKNGCLRSLQSAIIVCTREPLTAPALTIRQVPAATHYRRIGRAEAGRLADEFQPRLLRYRLARHLQVAKSQFDVPEFAPDTRTLARARLAPRSKENPSFRSDWWRQ